jgi:hypothetical protein
VRALEKEKNERGARFLLLLLFSFSSPLSLLLPSAAAPPRGGEWLYCGGHTAHKARPEQKKERKVDREKKEPETQVASQN